jgi:Nuclease A inhibitor-like protein
MAQRITPEPILTVRRRLRARTLGDALSTKILQGSTARHEVREDQVAALRAMMEELKNLEGFRVGEIQIKIFVLGKNDSGRVAGLQTLSVET